MKSLSAVSGELKWQQPSAAKAAHELWAGGDLVAALRFKSSFGSFATAETAEGAWTFKRSGFWAPKATVRVAGTEADIASVTPSGWTGKGDLVLRDGRLFKIGPNLWMTHYEIKSATDDLLVRYDVSGVFRMAARVTREPMFAQFAADVPWLTPFGWYVYLLLLQDTAAIATVAGVTAVASS